MPQRQQVPQLEAAVVQKLLVQLLGARQGLLLGVDWGWGWGPGVVKQAQVAEHMPPGGMELGFLDQTVSAVPAHMVSTVFECCKRTQQLLSPCTNNACVLTPGIECTVIKANDH